MTKYHVDAEHYGNRKMNKRRQNKLTKSYPLSDHYDGKQFFNPGLVIKKGFKDVLKMLREARGKNKWPKRVNNHALPQLAKNLTSDRTFITYINHASHLIQLQNLNILTDPIFSKRAGPFSLLGPKRVREPGIALKKLPHIDVVLISHNHYDHMDIPTLAKLEKMFHPLFIVPLGNRKYLKKKRFKLVEEIDWWQTLELNEMQSITSVPAQHWSRRKLNDVNKALWCGFLIRSGPIKIYFAGDTGYGPHFKKINQRFGPPDISILPIGSYEPRWFMKAQHMNPEEAVLASLDLNSPINIATHHQTFRLSQEGIYDPINELNKSKLLHGLKEEDFLAPENGETIIYISE